MCILKTVKVFLALPIFFSIIQTQYCFSAPKETNNSSTKEDKKKKKAEAKKDKTDKLNKSDKSDKSKSFTDIDFDDITTQEASNSEINYNQQKNIYKYNNVVSLFKPNYFLPFYYTNTPYYAVYDTNTPNNQKLMKTEFKGQLSLFMPMFDELFYIKDLSLNVAYTQLMYWQFYTASQYFRETNYEPYLFVKYRIHRNIFASAGVNHQSNGRGGELERSWNRVIGTIEYTGKNWYTQFSLWGLIFKNQSSDLHNPDIAHYLGNTLLVLSYDLYGFITSVEIQNLESFFERGHVMVTGSYPIHKKQVKAFMQYFSGYGQSQIEYNHQTQSFGIGLAFNDWQ